MSTPADISPRFGAFRVPFPRLWPLGTIIVIHALVALALGHFVGVPFDPGMARTLAMIFGILLPWFLLSLLIWRVAELFFRVRPERPISILANDIRAILSDVDRMVGGTIAFLLMALMVGSFGYIKALIAHLHHFAWDVTFAEWDRALHFGLDPWVLIWPITGSPLATTFLNAAYHFWLFLMYFAVFLASFAKVESTRAVTFLLALTLTFIIGGNVLAIIFSSAGPVYFERLGLGSDFELLMSQLRSFEAVSPVWALEVQELLWQGHIAEGPISGISAMPSMHVASTTLVAIYAWESGRLLRWGMVAFAAIIMIGSVHLGWHYAVDGYAGAAIALLCWKLSSFVVRWQSCPMRSTKRI